MTPHEFYCCGKKAGRADCEWLDFAQWCEEVKAAKREVERYPREDALRQWWVGYVGGLQERGAQHELRTAD